MLAIGRWIDRVWDQHVQDNGELDDDGFRILLSAKLELSFVGLS